VRDISWRKVVEEHVLYRCRGKKKPFVPFMIRWKPNHQWQALAEFVLRRADEFYKFWMPPASTSMPMPSYAALPHNGLHAQLCMYPPKIYKYEFMQNRSARRGA
jgi:hypothetical protein